MTWDLLSEQHGYAFLATTAPDGSPRLHPVAPIITPTGIHLAISAGSPKLRDLRRDPRLALHSSVRPPSDDELALRGRAVPVRDEDRRRTVEREGSPALSYTTRWSSLAWYPNDWSGRRVPDTGRSVVDSGRLAHVVTLDADGGPQVSCVRMDQETGPS